MMCVTAMSENIIRKFKFLINRDYIEIIGVAYVNFLLNIVSFDMAL